MRCSGRRWLPVADWAYLRRARKDKPRHLRSSRHRQPADDEQRHAKHQREPRQGEQADDDLYDDRHAADEAPLALELRMLAHGPGAAVVLGFEWLKLDAGEGGEFLRGHGAWSIGGCARSHLRSV